MKRRFFIQSGTIGILGFFLSNLNTYAHRPSEQKSDDDIEKTSSQGEQEEEELAYSLAVLATIWSYPIVLIAATANSLTAVEKPNASAQAPFNMFGSISSLPSASNKEVVALNADTLYSSAFIDLKQGAALVSVPAEGDRYYALMLTDAYSNVFDYIGTRVTGKKAGKYLIVGPNWKGKIPAGIKAIYAPTSLVWIIGRTLVDGKSDLPNVAAIQEQYKIEMILPTVDKTPILKRWDLQTAPSKVPVKQVESLDWKSYFTWTGSLMKDNPPPVADSGLYSQFSVIGLNVKNGFDAAALSPSTLAGIERGFQDGKNIIKTEALKTGSLQVNGWGYNLDTGNFGQNYLLRAAVAYRGLGQNLPIEALYLSTRTDDKKVKLQGDKNYKLTFEKGNLPPVDAFWSLTMYYQDSFFVDNPINCYAIGDRNKGLKYNSDGSLTIYIQNLQPEEDKVSNWLPSAKGEFRITLRLYNPHKEVLLGKWMPPAPTVA